MKRSAGEVEGSADVSDHGSEDRRETKAFRRQNPVSCQFCRSKKLRCDRAQPCSNCVARGISCASAFGAFGPSGGGGGGDGAGHGLLPVAGTGNQNLNDFKIIDSRLRALEQAVFRRSNVPNQPETPEAIEDGTISKTAKWIEADAGTIHGSKYTAILDDPASPYDNPPEKNLATVLGQGHPSPIPSLSFFDVVTNLPSKAMANVLLDHYVKNLSWFNHIIHGPTTRKDLAMIYSALDARQMPPPPHLALLATILAIAMYFRSGQSDISVTREEEKSSCAKWTLLAQMALADSNYLETPTVESMQAKILLAQFLPQHGQYTPYISALTHTAHILQLHRVDSARNRQRREETGFNFIELEIKRRIWWYIAGTDWLLCFMSGPQCGTYVCHPDQMSVVLPSNVDDEDITATSIHPRPLSEPTDMSYSLCKIELAQTLRELIDEANKDHHDVEEMSYDQITHYDRIFNNHLDNALQWYYKMDEASLRRSEALDKQRPCMLCQRLFVHFAYHTRLSRLHRPFLARGYKDPRYAYSRMICLRSARTVIDLEQRMRQAPGGFHPDSGRLWIIIHHVFVATVTLVMDYVSHRNDPEAAERKLEILKCYKILERSQEESAIAKRGLAHLKQVMKNWMTKSDNSTAAAATTTTTVTNDRPVPNPSLTSDVPLGPIKPTINTPYMTNNQPSQNTTPYVPTRDTAPDRSQTGAIFPISNNGTWPGMDIMQDIWMDPVDISMISNDPQWEILFRDLENQPGTYS